jgi:N-acetylglucosamine malate deacetylase 2
MKKLLSCFILLLFFFSSDAQKDSTRILMITAHPDDESAFAVTIYKLTHEAGGAADLVVITNGEAGYKYSTLAEPIYKLKLTDETTGRKHLPLIRKKEMIAAGTILGISNFYFLDQQDNHYTLDVDTVFREVWDTVWIKQRLRKIVTDGNYDFIFCLLPLPETHGHHKGATILALQAVNELPLNKRPVILGTTVSNKSDTTATDFKGLKNFPLTAIVNGRPDFQTDRTRTFGYKSSLTYKLVVNWLIAEHKSQGSIQAQMNRGDYESFWYFDLNDLKNKSSVQSFFNLLNSYQPK